VSGAVKLSILMPVYNEARTVPAVVKRITCRREVDQRCLCVRNTGDTVAVSMHIYGADISRLGNSIRREYALPVLR
jgi:hypothetical protein